MNSIVGVGSIVGVRALQFIHGEISLKVTKVSQVSFGSNVVRHFRACVKMGNEGRLVVGVGRSAGRRQEITETETGKCRDRTVLAAFPVNLTQGRVI